MSARRREGGCSYQCPKYLYKFSVSKELKQQAIKRMTSDDIWRYAKVYRAANVLRPYLEGLG